jgi:hypothetical protein
MIKMNKYRILKLKPLKNFKLLIEFMDNKKFIYDLKSFIDNNNYDFSYLYKIKGLFGNVFIQLSGDAIFWTDEIDLSSITLRDGKYSLEITDEEFNYYIENEYLENQNKEYFSFEISHEEANKILSSKYCI